MFAYIATPDAKVASDSYAALTSLAAQCDVYDTPLRQVSLSNFRLCYFDTDDDLTIYRDEQYLVLLCGLIINEDDLRNAAGHEIGSNAELALQLFKAGASGLEQIDGHFSLLVYDANSESISLVCDRFQRYSVVYTTSDALCVSSHAYLAYAVSKVKSLDIEALAQAVHFRWHTGERKLFSGIRQLLPGSITTIDKGGTVHRTGYFSFGFSRETDTDVDYWVKELDEAIDSCFSRIAKRHKTIGVPLSGGVDSSLLLAKAMEHFDECVAVTARFRNGANPELPNACHIADQLGVRHIIADIDDDYIERIFPKVITLHEQAPRNFSDIALCRSLEALADEVDGFIYGEAADTLFGLNAVHRIVDVERLAWLFRLLPTRLRRLISMGVPRRGGRLRRLKWALSEDVHSLVHSMEKIDYVTPPSLTFPCGDSPVWDDVLQQYLGCSKMPTGDKASIQLLATGVMNHIENTGRLASYYGLKMFVPFVLNDIRAVATRLPFELQNQGGVYKIVLRELASRYVDRDIMFANKHGFPTPIRNWLNGPLKDRVQRSILGAGGARSYYSLDSLSALSVDHDFEHFWLAICLDELLLQFSSQVGFTPINSDPAKITDLSQVSA